jgi:hypothetical protein
MADYRSERYLYELRGLADYPFLGDNTPDRPVKTARAMRILDSELPRLAMLTGKVPPQDLAGMSPTNYTRSKQAAIKAALDRAEQDFRERRREASDRLEAQRESLRRELGRYGVDKLKRDHYNRELAKLALGLQSLEDLRLGHSRIVQVTLPVCQEPESYRGRAHFLAAFKRVGPLRISTLAFNLTVLGLMALLLYAALYASVLTRVLRATALVSRIRRRRRTR